MDLKRPHFQVQLYTGSSVATPRPTISTLEELGGESLRYPSASPLAPTPSVENTGSRGQQSPGHYTALAERNLRFPLADMRRLQPNNNAILRSSVACMLRRAEILYQFVPRWKEDSPQFLGDHCLARNSTIHATNSILVTYKTDLPGK